MPFIAILRRLLIPTILLVGLPGCLSLYRERPVVVMVRDAETKQPIAGADVHLSYPLARPSDLPDESSNKTAADGMARLATTPNGKDALRIEATANGYLPESTIVSDKIVEEIEPAWLLESVERRPQNFTLELYSGPPFAVELTVPTGFRGLIKAQIQLNEQLACAPGQRQFSFTVAPSGEVQVVGPKLLGKVPPAAYLVRFADGTLVSNRMDTTQVGFRWLKHEGTYEYFVVGTQPEYDGLRRQLFPDDHAAPATGGGRSSGGRGGGGGRRGGGGRGGMGGSSNFGGSGGFSQ